MAKKFFAAGACAAALAGVTVGSAFAGEVTGTGEPTGAVTNAHSICAFSGLNDDPEGPGLEAGRVQSFGQIVRQVGPIGGVPGVACNPTSGGGGH